jgi:hypothetical protein
MRMSIALRAHRLKPVPLLGEATKRARFQFFMVGAVREGKYAGVDYHQAIVQHSSGQAGFLALLLCLLLSGLFSLAASGKLPLLVSEVRTRFQFVGFAGVTVEVKDFLGVFGHDQYWGRLSAKFCPTTTRKWFGGNARSVKSTIPPPLSTPKPTAFFSAVAGELFCSVHETPRPPQIVTPPAQSYLTSDGTSLFANVGSPPLDGIDCRSPSMDQPALCSPAYIWEANIYASLSSCLYNIRTSPTAFPFRSSANLSKLTCRQLALMMSDKRIRRMLSDASSAKPPWYLSNPMPANTASPIETITNPLTVSRCLYHFRIGVVAFRPRSSGKRSGGSGQNDSIRNSASTPINKISFPTSRQCRWYASASSSAWLIPDSTWTLNDYDRADRIVRRIGDVLLVLIFIAWVLRFARVGRPW